MKRQDSMNVIGLMSGTSLDGVDVALVEISERHVIPLIVLKKFETFPFPARIREQIFRWCSSEKGIASEMCRLHFELGEIFADAVLKFTKMHHLKLSEIDLIGSHGQTISHGRGATLQIGEAAVIAEKTGITTVSDFRAADVAAGGEGAPLAPYLHYLLFHHLGYGMAVQNIGGMSNLTYLQKGEKGGRLQDMIAFDTGPGNVLIDEVVRQLTKKRKQYDEEGRLAARGTVNGSLLKKLLRHPFILKSPPKSTGREEFGTRLALQILKEAKARHLKSHDIVATVTAFTAHSIAENYKKFILPKFQLKEIVIGGGGARNKTLYSMIQRLLPSVQLKRFEDYHLNSDAIEAMAFAVLAYEAVHGEALNLRSVTGALHPMILGKVSPGHNFKRVLLN